MKIYFARSIRGERDSTEKFNIIMETLKRYGEVLTEHIDPKTIIKEERKHFTEEQIYTEDADWIKESDIVVAEVSVPSLGVGYELAFAESLEKRVLCLYDSNSKWSLSAMVAGNKYFEIIKYSSVEELAKKLQELF